MSVYSFAKPYRKDLFGFDAIHASHTFLKHEIKQSAVSLNLD
jgi:hypothetical protein